MRKSVGAAPRCSRHPGGGICADALRKDGSLHDRTKIVGTQRAERMAIVLGPFDRQSRTVRGPPLRHPGQLEVHLVSLAA